MGIGESECTLNARLNRYADIANWCMFSIFGFYGATLPVTALWLQNASHHDTLVS